MCVGEFTVTPHSRESSELREKKGEIEDFNFNFPEVVSSAVFERAFFLFVQAVGCTSVKIEMRNTDDNTMLRLEHNGEKTARFF